MTRSYSSAESRWAGIGPYYAMFPSRFCKRIVERFTQERDLVLDPFAGRGTALYSASVLGRVAAGVEINPVGWLYAAAKLHPGRKSAVVQRLQHLKEAAELYADEASALPIFFHKCYCRAVRQFLLASRDILDWRHSVVDRTLMALLLVNLHGKRHDSLSNQMRQTKAMAPAYAVRWWKERDLSPPKVDVASFLLKKLEWRYAKGLPSLERSFIYRGDATRVLPRLAQKLSDLRIPKARLLLTSPPYLKITNYHYDQWIRLWMLGGAPNDRLTDSPFHGENRGKFSNEERYRKLLLNVFSLCRSMCHEKATIYVRTDWREPTRSITKEILQHVFHRHELRQRLSPLKGETQTRLFGYYAPHLGEVDLILTR